MKLTKNAIAMLGLDGKTDAIFFDDEVPGFGIRLRLAAGGKVARNWIVQWKRSGATNRIRIGSAGVLDVKAARDQARKILGRVALGEDPSADRRDRREKDALTFRSQAAEFLAAKESELAPRSHVEATRYLTDPRYFGPLHSKPLDSIALRDVAARIVVIQRECGDPTAARARGALTSFFTWAMRMGLCSANLCVGSINPEVTARDRVLSPDEIARVWAACADDDYGKIVRLLILLGARREEIGGLAHSELRDLDGPAPTWTLTKERSKNGRAHTLPLMPMALAIVRSAPRMASRDQLFGERAAEGFTTWGKSKAALDRRCGVRGWVVHDIRRSVATGMGDIGIAPHVIEQILNHRSGPARGGALALLYNKSRYDREVRPALARWEDHIRTLVDGGERKVIPLPQFAS
jgi:integrase